MDCVDVGIDVLKLALMTCVMQIDFVAYQVYTLIVSVNLFIYYINIIFKIKSIWQHVYQ